MRSFFHRLIAISYTLHTKWLLYRVNQFNGDLSKTIWFLKNYLNRFHLPFTKAKVRTLLAPNVTGLIVSKNTDSSHQAILYFHGGAFIVGSPHLFVRHAYQLARACEVPVYIIDYRMLPDFSYQDTLTDAMNAYKHLLSTGILPKHICIGGDSAGGGLAISLLFILREQHIPLPASVVCLSPWVDLSLSTPSMMQCPTKDYILSFDLHWVQQITDLYSKGHNKRDPLISPLYGDFSDLPPFMIHSGGDERLLDENKLLVEALKKAGVAVEHEIWPHMPHDFPLLPLTEAKLAFKKIGAFVQRHFN